MKLGEAESWLRNELLPLYGSEESAAITAVVLEHITGLSRIDQLNKSSEALSADKLQQLLHLAPRLKNAEPVQYLLGEAPFYGLNLYVNGSVLIPRPETEELVEWIIKDIENKGLPVFDKTPTEADLTDKLKVLDVGTGSGCIALALKKRLPLAEVWGCDVSEEALNVARRNGSELDIRVDFQGVDFLDATQQRSLPTVNIVVSNPPYIPSTEKGSMHQNVVNYEPHQALFVPEDDALIFYKALAHFGKHRLYSGGAIYCEIHEKAAPAVTELFEKEGYDPVLLKKDMQGKDRMVKAVKP